MRYGSQHGVYLYGGGPSSLLYVGWPEDYEVTLNPVWSVTAEQGRRSQPEPMPAPDTPVLELGPMGQRKIKIPE